MFWKFTYSGKYSTKYISLILDFHETYLDGDDLLLSFSECQDILILMHDVEVLNSTQNNSAGILKDAFVSPVKELGWTTTDQYTPLRYSRGLVYGKMNLGVHDGEKLEFGKISLARDRDVRLNTRNLRVSMMIDAKTGIIYGTEDKLKAYRSSVDFIPEGRYYDLMPVHECMKEIVRKMFMKDENATVQFLTEQLKWKKIV